MLGKRLNLGDSEIVPYGWACAAICNWACIRTADALCKCSKTSAKSSSNSYISNRKADHMRNLLSSGD